MIEDISFWERTPYVVDDDEAEMSQDSKQEKRMEVEKPPRILPMNSIGRKLKSIKRQDAAYDMQKIIQVRLRPFWSAQSPTMGEKKPALVNPVTNKTATVCSVY